MSKGDSSCRFRQSLALSAAIRVIALPKAMVNVIGVADQGLMWAWRCWPGMRATAKDATGQGYVLLATGQGYVRLVDEPGGQCTRGVLGVDRDALRTL
jgi:hypothetical protein